MKLIIAEKPSVAQSLAKVLGAAERHDGYLQGNGLVISWCVGHLVELCNAEQYDEALKAWSYQTLPILPNPWRTAVQPDKQAQFAILKRWMNDSRISEVVCATDAGREGELIFRWVYEQAGCKKPILRLWISSMEDSAIHEGFAHLQDGRNYENLYQSALCRAKADWMVGINFTRLFSVLYQQKNMNIGRVMTPTLALVVQRQKTISSFHSQPFFHVCLDCGGFAATSERFPDRESAQQLQAACHGQPAVVESVSKKTGSELPPKLYDLTTLQREANRILDYTAQQTLDCLQALYEKKLCTYPRTDSQYLTEDMAESTGRLIGLLQDKLLPDSLKSAPEVSRLIHNAKVSDHHAILPTAEVGALELSELPPEQRNILLLCSFRLLCAAAPKHTFETTTATLRCAGQPFTAKGKILLEPGWKAIEMQGRQQLGKAQSEDEKPEEKMLPPLHKQQVLDEVSANIKEGKTSPPKPYTEDTLLSAMETAGNDAIDEDAEKKGLGTPATRAATIEKLVHTGMLERKNKQLLPTDKGTNLIALLPDSIQSPRLTAEWENHLNKIANGELAPDVFLGQISSMVERIVKQNYAPKEEFVHLFPPEPQHGEVIGICPRCQNDVVERSKSFSCTNPDCKFVLWKNDRFFTSKKKELTKRVAKSLLSSGKIALKGLYSERSGKTYDATIFLDDTGGQYVNFRMEFEKSGKK